MIPVNKIHISLSNMGFVVFLRGYQEKTLPIFIGALEAQSIALFLEGASIPRPLTHDLMKNILDNLECRMKRAEVSDLRENTFFAKLILEWGGVESEIDARPSDAIALALRFSAPIYIAEEVMNTAGIVLGKKAPDAPDQEPPPGVELADAAEALKKKLDKAITEERYEEAAKLRDELKKISRSN